MPLLCQWSRLFVYLLVGILSESECLCPNLGMYSDCLAVPPLTVSLRRVNHIVSGVLMTVVVVRVYVWPTDMHCLRDLSNICHRPLHLWCRQWIHPLIPLWLWCPLLRGLPVQDVLLTVVYTPVGVVICVVSLGHLCPNIFPGVDSFLGILSLHW